MADRKQLRAYLGAVIAEVLRWISIAPVSIHPALTICVILTAPPQVSREVTKDDHYGGHLIPKGAQRAVSNWTASRTSEYTSW